ncbi:tetratricopeptide repeat protein [Flavihumibacter petaseus]|uniref:Uncharacterized protein n=1 Tax=Flavihumibacter petaseus NBRC 106054 TaxID=1220578 RepID=A0A0E9MVV5_9BACT|nr:tetratricopeptide repeat protein [Flavihumibacter petaseus]GAO41724.1 hypothetical protein FPE01S_01_07380 [Flavihumibacter petaseus NBRC 106054]
MKKLIILFFLITCWALSGGAQFIPADSTVLAKKQLVVLQETAKKNGSIRELIRLGCWRDAELLIARLSPEADSVKVFRAELAILNNEFPKAQQIVDGVIRKQPEATAANVLKANLEMQAWRLNEATKYADKVLRAHPGNAGALLQKGRVLLLQKQYDAALSCAEKVIQADPANAAAYLLLADIQFWNQHPEKAEAPLRRALELDPYNADARFAYGYAIWRRIDARQLPAMAAQWELALAVNPLHYQTHWHWGNGHTPLTYADYAAPDDDKVRLQLKAADSLIRLDQVNAAITITRKVEKDFPGSVIPLLHRGSIYYSAFDLNRNMRLDSAQALFLRVLARKSHYGPAHNGLSAVIKSKRIPYLQAYDSIMQVLHHTKIADPKNFYAVFDDLDYYSGDFASAMVWQQLYTAVVYFPFLSRQNDAFKIPPLHIDLATCMQAPYFRIMTTFDNRQWMDIRGVGSGAAAIEYVERGAFLERNVVLHEYVHLFHSDVLTEAENRAIRRHYYTAMQEGRTLDYYSQNNEHEYFAQTYPAYFEPVKVHPLDFKSMNTRAELQRKDPQMFAFLDSLVKKEKAYLAGDRQAMASNWAQVYCNLSQQVREGEWNKAAALLDTALSFDSRYLPAYTSYARLKAAQRDTAGAWQWLNKALTIDSLYAPVYAAQSLLQQHSDTAIVTLKKAITLETDLQELASLHLRLTRLYQQYARMAEAVTTADHYQTTGSSLSTYLRDRKDDVAAIAASIRANSGSRESLATLADLVSRKPQNYEYRLLYADALMRQHQPDSAIAVLKYAQRIMAAAGNTRADFSLRLAEAYDQKGLTDSLAHYVHQLKDKTDLDALEQLRFIRILQHSGDHNKAEVLLAKVVPGKTTLDASAYYFTRATVMTESSDQLMADLEKSVSLNPYDTDAVEELVKRYKQSGDQVKLAALLEKQQSVRL